MSSALDEFRAQREAIEDLHRRLSDVADLARATRDIVARLDTDEGLRGLVRDEQAWLVKAEQLVAEMRRFRQAEAAHFWPAVMRRWVAVTALIAVSALAAGAAYAWTHRATEAEIAELRARVGFADGLAHRVLQMTPAERRQFERLMR